jgi:hypothetical protein
MAKDGGIRGGVPREIIIKSIGEVDPAEGSQITYWLSGRSGKAKLAGDDVMYSESNPHLGGFTQDISVDASTHKKLCDLQSSGKFDSVTVTLPSGDILDCNVKVDVEGKLDNNNGVVSLEMAGEVRLR